jgi:lipopolysaccharide/colanic/teichoic acid biosynthesis glycosyltransferase
VLQTFYARKAKRALDALAATTLLAMLSPLLLCTWAIVRLRLGAPVLFTQLRIGRGGQPFHIVKFRTMTGARDSSGQLLPDEKRMTALGRLLRNSSLDELPELWNILRGEMSFVGPRPLLPEYLQHYTPEESRRHEALPGLTGWAQVNGRNAVAWEERFRLDVWYVDHVSFWLDLKILVLTVARVFSQKGVSAEGHATMPRFDLQRRHTNSGRRAA